MPITLNYDRVVDGEVFPFDLLGENTKQESFASIIKHMNNTRKQLGRVIVRYGEPISIEKLILQYTHTSDLSNEAIAKDDKKISTLSIKLSEALTYA